PRVLWEYRGTVALLCLFTIVGKIVSTAFGAIASGQSFRNSVRVGFGLAQIGEFSFIIATLGMTLEVTSHFVYPIIVAVSAVTTFTTPYLIRVSGPAAELLERRLPPGIRNALNRYAVLTEERRTSGVGGRELRRLLYRWSLNGLIVSIVFIAGARVLLPFLLREVGRGPIVPAVLAWAVCATLSAPFVWAMFSMYRRHYESHPTDRASRMIPVAGSRALTLTLVIALTAEFFPGRYLVLLLSLVLLLFFVVFRRRLETYYRWYERNFLQGIEGAAAGTLPLSQLAPWDAHFVQLRVHPNSPLVLRRISEAALRTRLGVNVVAVQRGLRTLVAPEPDSVLLPGDELILLGTDLQLEKLRQELEAPAGAAEAGQGTADYELRNYRLDERSPLAGQTIRQSGIREKFHSMIIGLERGNHRTINPDSDMALLPGDTLWIVGERSYLENLAVSESLVS
ncbi:MAG: cation:proton antiporter, partial [Oligoflexia bacterium]|nr:cation:proton antiporter [Oligoflexia bacterium]